MKTKKDTQTIVDLPEPILWHLLGTKRPHLSKGIQACMLHIINLAPKSAIVGRDQWDNLWIDLRGGKSRTLFAGHLDTVESKEGKNLLYYSKSGLISTNGRDVLGADDGAGCAMMVSLMLAKVPGLYVFTQGEECGSQAAKSAVNDPRLNDIDRCIAFDRKGRFDIVADQAKGILASRAFVTALSDAIGMKHGWAIGSYTDSSEFHKTIKEIVNISIGYQANHSVHETLDYPYFCDLRKACLKVDWEALPTVGPEPKKTIHFPAYQGRFWEDDDYYSSYDAGVYTRRTTTTEPTAKGPIPLYPSPWDTSARLLCRTLGYDPNVDIEAFEAIAKEMRFVHASGVREGRKEVYDLNRLTHLGFRK